MTHSRPYIIGLAGGIASGKTNIGKKLTQLGADVIDCDQLAHIAYLPDTDAYRQIVQTFGDDVVGDDGLIDRRRLGAKVFGNKVWYLDGYQLKH